MNANWFSAIDSIFRVVWEQSQATFDDNFNLVSYYNWTGGNGALSPAVPNGGNNAPRAYTGLVGTHHRPSDDITTFCKLFANTTQRRQVLSTLIEHSSIFDSCKRNVEC